MDPVEVSKKLRPFGKPHPHKGGYSKSEESRNLISEGNKGKKRSNETRDRMARSAYLRWSRLSDERKSFLRKLSIRVLRVEDGRIWPSITECAKELGLNKELLSEYIKRGWSPDGMSYKFLDRRNLNTQKKSDNPDGGDSASNSLQDTDKSN